MKFTKLIIFSVMLSILLLSGCRKKSPNNTPSDNNQESNDFLFAVDDVFEIKGSGVVVTGYIFDGSISVGDKVYYEDGTGKPQITTVKGIETNRQMLESATKGDIVGILISDIKASKVSQGHLLLGDNALTDHQSFSAVVEISEENHKELLNKDTLNAQCQLYGKDYEATIYIESSTPDEEGFLPVRVELPKKLPMKIGIPFSIYIEDNAIAWGKVSQFDE